MPVYSCKDIYARLITLLTSVLPPNTYSILLGFIPISLFITFTEDPTTLAVFFATLSCASRKTGRRDHIFYKIPPPSVQVFEARVPSPSKDHVSKKSKENGSFSEEEQ